MLTKIALAAFSDELRRIQVADADTPPDYLETRVATMTKLGMYLPQMLAKGVNAVKPHAGHAAELAGLGILAKPSIDELRGKEVNQRRKAGMEVAGLGVLAAPSALSIGKHLLRRH